MPGLLSLRRWHSLRGHAALAFAALVLAVSTAVAVGVWGSVSHFLMTQRERTTTAQAVANAEQVQRGLHTPGLDQPELLSQLRREIGSVSLLADGDEWFTTSLGVGRDDLPAALRKAVVAGQPMRQRIEIGERTMLVVGVPLAGLNEAYFEVFLLEELDRTLQVLSTVLVVSVALVPVAALTLGWWVTRPALKPLKRVSDAAASIAAGDLGTRIDPRGDPELTPIAESFNATAAALERRVRSDARFAADVSHELRTPLTTMMSAIALLEDHRHRLPDDGREAVDLMASEVSRFTRLVQDLLEISRSDAGSADLDAQQLSLAGLVYQALPDRLQPRLVVETSAVDLLVRADKRRLERVVANLVDNAESHGGGLVEIRVRRCGVQAEVVVDDAGPGVSAQERERVFERFARGRGSDRGTTGAGLGLALVARHLELMGGDVRVDDSPHGGARFVMSLPVEDESCER